MVTDSWHMRHCFLKYTGHSFLSRYLKCAVVCHHWSVRSSMWNQTHLSPLNRTAYSLARGWQADSCFFFPLRLDSETCIGIELDHLALKAIEYFLYKFLSNPKAKSRVHPHGLCFFPCVQCIMPEVEVPVKLSLLRMLRRKKQRFKASQNSRVTLSHKIKQWKRAGDTAQCLCICLAWGKC